MTNYTPRTFLNKISGHNFKSENELVRYFETIAPAIFEINKTRIVKELRTTANDGTLSNLADLIILDNFDRTQALVGFEFKLDRSITNYKGGSYEDAANQLHKYCQQLRVPYGVLISDRICEIYKYSFRGSIFNFEKVICLPALTEIEKELKLGVNPIKEKPEQTFFGKNKLLVIGFVLLMVSITFWKLGGNKQKSTELALPLENCTQIKGNVTLNRDGSIEGKIYHVPGSRYYDSVKLKSTDGDRCIRTDQEAIEAGFTKSKAY